MKNRAAFLDLDGVVFETLEVNEKPSSIRNLNDVQLCDNAEIAIRKLKMLGYMVICITNQPDIARGNYPLTNFLEIKNWLIHSLKFDSVYFCPHDDAVNCLCRKPKNGMLLNAIDDYGIEKSHSFLVGDRWKDIEAGQNTGLKCFFIRNFPNEKQPIPPFVEVASLFNAVQLIELNNV